MEMKIAIRWGRDKGKGGGVKEKEKKEHELHFFGCSNGISIRYWSLAMLMSIRIYEYGE